MKYSQWIGVAATLLLIGSCFLHWSYYPDIQKYFTGFSSEGNQYGKPGWFLSVFSLIAMIFFVTPKVWAKRWNLLICCLIIAFAIRNYIVFTTCYRGICPEKQAGIWLMLCSAVIMMLAALLPDLKISDQHQKKSGE